MQAVQGHKEAILKVFQDVSGDLQVIVNLFDIISHSPEVVTKELIDKAKNKVKGVLKRVGELQNVVRKGETEKLVEDVQEAGIKFPEIILEEVVRHFEEKINTQMTVYANEGRTLSLADRDFEYVLKSLFDSALKTQEGMFRKTCEVSMASKGKNMVLRFKDFQRSIPREHLEDLFNGNVASNEYGGGYPFYKMKKLLQRVGGDIAVDSDRTRFTTFTVTIPFDFETL